MPLDKPINICYSLLLIKINSKLNFMTDTTLPTLPHAQGAQTLYEHLGATAEKHDAANLTLPIEQKITQQQQANISAEKTSDLSDQVPAAKNIFKTALPYAAVFIIGLGIYLFAFTGFSLQSFFSKPKVTVKQAISNTITPEQLTAYNNWINTYFFDVSDPKIVSPDYDYSGNGLTNYQKFLLGLNPKRTDTIGLGMNDLDALMQGIDPLSGKPLSDAENKIIAANIDLEAISNKNTLAALNSSARVLGANTSDSRYQSLVDMNVPGEVNIPSLKLSAPLIWSKDTNSIETDLQNGLVHYPGTPMPGETGTTYISGHSSNYIWAKGSFNQIFAKLGDLKQYDSFTISAQQANGKKIIFHYVVSASGIFKADDQQQFANIGKSTVALSTCWPVGTSSKRLVVFAQLTQIEE